MSCVGLSLFREDQDPKTDKGMHTYKDFGLKMYYYNPGTPQIEEHNIQVPFSNRSMRMSGVFGGPFYTERQFVAKFTMGDMGYQQWDSVRSKLDNLYHGMVVKIVSDLDKGYYYLGTLNFEYEKEHYAESDVVLTCIADPYKYAVRGPSDKWLWDTFNFVNGVIRYIGEQTITAQNNKIKIVAGEMETAVIVNVKSMTSSSMTVSCDGEKVALKRGKNRIPDIRVGGKEEKTLIFSGTGTVEIDYREGRL